MPQTDFQHKQRLREAWGGDASFATTLYVLLVDVYSTAALSWDEETLRISIEADFDVVLPQANMDRLMVAIALETTDDFYNSLPDFVPFCNVLSGDLYNPSSWDPADALEIAWGITEALLICPPDNDEPFSPEILGYIGKALDDEGIITPPDVLRIATRQDPLPLIHAEFSDDVEMFQAIYGAEKSKTDDINNNVRERLQRLSVQLDGLPLRAGSAKGAVRRMLGTLKK